LNGDARRLVQLFSNLLENSFRYTEKGGRCEVRVEAATDSIIARVDDSQPGVPEAAMGQLFERLYRVEGSRSRQHGGAGLGLAICRNIVEAHGGSISARPSPLGGLQVRVEFPRRGQHG
jgi:two-component system sensor histidine kinase BaeS